MIILIRPCAVTPATTAPTRPRPISPARDFDAEAGNVGQAVVKRRHVIPEARRGAGDAAVSGADRPTGVIVPLHHRTVEGRRRALAAHLVQTPAFAMPFVAPLGDESAGVVVRAALALIVNDAAVGEQRPVVLIERGQIVEGQVMHQHRRRIGRIVRAAGHVDHLDPGHGLLNAQRAGRIGLGADQPAVERAGAHGDGGRGVAADLSRRSP